MNLENTVLSERKHAMWFNLNVVQNREIYIERFLLKLLLRARGKAVKGTGRDSLRDRLFLWPWKCPTIDCINGYAYLWKYKKHFIYFYKVSYVVYELYVNKLLRINNNQIHLRAKLISILLKSSCFMDLFILQLMKVKGPSKTHCYLGTQSF